MKNLKFKSFADFLQKFKISSKMIMYYIEKPTKISKVYDLEISFESGEVEICIFNHINKFELIDLKSNKDIFIVSKNQIKEKKLPKKYYLGKKKPKYQTGQIFIDGEDVYIIKKVCNFSIYLADKDNFSYLIIDQKGVIYLLNESKLSEEIAKFKKGNENLGKITTKKKKIPNATTLKAFKDAKEGKVKRFSSGKELIKNLNK